MKLSTPFHGPTRRLTTALIAFLAAAAGSSPAAAQGDATRSTGDREVVSVVETFFTGMLEKDADKLRSTVAPNAVLWGVTRRNGQTTVTTTSMEQFITTVTQRPGEGADERIYEPRVEMDGGTAHVWTFYTLHVGERFIHCGYDSFQLLRTPDGWKIVSVADTRRTENCEPPGG